MRCPHDAAWLVTAWLVAVHTPTPSAAQDTAATFAGKTMKLIVGMPPGGGVDAYARLLQRHLARHIPGAPPIVVQNMPGAGSLRAVMALATSPEDGTHIVTFSSALLTEAILSPARVKIDFRGFGFLGNVGEDVRVCFVRSPRGIRSWPDLVASEGVVFGATAAGTSGNVDVAMLRGLFGIRLRQVQGYAGSADKRLALEKGEIDGDCGGWTALPEDWIAQRKIDVVLRLSPTLLPGLRPESPYGGDLLGDSPQRRVFELLTAPLRLGRLFMLSGKVAPERIAALRAAFDTTMTDAAFLSEALKFGLTVSPTSGPEVARRVTALYGTSPAVLERAKALARE